MNLESNLPKKNEVVSLQDDLSLEEFDFKPITTGLGFHHPKTSEIKPVFTEKNSLNQVNTFNLNTKQEMANVYQNDLSLFYGQSSSQALPAIPTMTETEEKIIRNATKAQRVIAYVIDLLFLTSILGIVLTVMARTISMDLMEVWTAFPNEITPLVAVLFSGFYLIYFSIFEKAPQTTFGKSMLGLKVVGCGSKPLSFSVLFFRAFISLVNFVSLGLFSYFDLQNIATNSRVVRG